MAPPRQGGSSVSLILGEFQVPEISEGQRFRAQIGREIGDLSKELIPAVARVQVNGRTVFDRDIPLFDRLFDIDVDLSNATGKNARVVIEVHQRRVPFIGQGANAIHWVNPRISTGD